MSEPYRNDESNASAPGAASVGGAGEQSASDMLRNARERLGLSQKDVADQLFLTTTFIGYIDAGEFDKILKPAFIKGYLRSYARVVHLSGDEVVACYQRGLDEAEDAIEIRDVTEESLGPSNFTGPVLKTGMAGLVGLLVVVAVVWWVVAGGSDTPGNDAGPVVTARSQSESASTDVPDTAFTVAEEASAESSSGMVEPATAADEGAGTATTMDEMSRQEETGPAGGAGSQEEATAGDAAEQAADEKNVEIQRVSDNGINRITVDAGGDDEVRLSFSDECWVEITDGDGATVYGDLNRKGDLLTVNGIAPFEVLLGRATSVKLYFNDKAVDLGPYVTSDKTARVSLGG